jgi:hypothetical protein
MERPLSYRTALRRLAASLTRTLQNPDTRALALVLGAASADGTTPAPAIPAPRIRTCRLSRDVPAGRSG